MFTIRTSPWLVTALLFAVGAGSAGAQTAPSAARQRIITPYSAAQEVTLQGNIQEVVGKAVPGSSLGPHLVVATPTGPVNANLGLFSLKGPNAADLHTGAAVQITGAMRQVATNQLFLVRTITFGNQTLTLRNAHGFPAWTSARASRATTSRSRAPRTRASHLRPPVTGGAR